MDKQDFEALYPTGVEVPLDDGLIVVVLPIGIRHIFPIQDAVSKIVAAALNAQADSTEDSKLLGAIAASVLPILLTDAFAIVVNSTVIAIKEEDGTLEPDFTRDIGGLPHWNIPPIVEAWTELNFGEEKKLSPWIRVLEKAITRMTKKTFSLSEFLSEISSKRATLGKTSSTNKDTTVEDGNSPTGDGQSDSLDSGERPPPEQLSEV